MNAANIKDYATAVTDVCSTLSRDPDNLAARAQLDDLICAPKLARLIVDQSSDADIARAALLRLMEPVPERRMASPLPTAAARSHVA